MRIRILTLCFVVFGLSAMAQSEVPDTATYYLITRHDGIEYVGTILKDDGKEVTLYSDQLGMLILEKKSLKSIVKIEDKQLIKDGGYYPEESYGVRYSLTSSAYSTPKGKHYTVMNLFGPEVHFAASNKLNIGLITTWIVSPTLLSLKYTFTRKNARVALSASGMVGYTNYIRSLNTNGATLMLNATFGNWRNHLTLSAGYGYVNPRFEDGLFQEGQFKLDYRSELPRKQLVVPGPIVSMATKMQISHNVALLLESIYFNVLVERSQVESSYSQGYFYYTVRNNVKRDHVVVVNPGVRVSMKRNSAFQFCLTGITAKGRNEGSFAVPVVSFFKSF